MKKWPFSNSGDSEETGKYSPENDLKREKMEAHHMMNSEFTELSDIENGEIVELDELEHEDSSIFSKIPRFWVVLVVMLVVACLFRTISSMQFTSIPSEQKTELNTNTETVVSLIDNSKFYYTPTNIGIGLGGYLAELSIDLSNANVIQCDILNNEASIVYQNEAGTVQNEIYIGSGLLEKIGNFTKEEVKAVLESDDTVKTKLDDGKSSGVAVNETLASVYKLGYLYVRESQLLDKEEAGNEDEADANEAENEVKAENSFKVPDELEIDSEGFALSLRDSMTFSKGNPNDCYINMEDFGRLNINDLSAVKDSTGLLYRVSDGMICISNQAEGKVKVFITYMGNARLLNVGEQLIPTDYNNVYVDYGWRNSADWGYRSFGIMTPNGMYYFKIGESVENLIDFTQEFIDWLGVKPDDAKLTVPYEMELTLDDLRPTLEEEESTQQNN